jgi:outer membrane cobalamin receptor
MQAGMPPGVSTLAWAAQWIGRRYDFSVPHPDEVTVGGYSNSNAVAAYDCTERATVVYLRADNLWNSKYHEYIGFPASEISVRLGVSLRAF